MEQLTLGDQLTQVRLKVAANLEEIPVDFTGLPKIGSGMGFPKFREVCNLYLAAWGQPLLVHSDQLPETKKALNNLFGVGGGTQPPVEPVGDGWTQPIPGVFVWEWFSGVPQFPKITLTGLEESHIYLFRWRVAVLEGSAPQLTFRAMNDVGTDVDATVIADYQTTFEVPVGETELYVEWIVNDSTTTLDVLLGNIEVLDLGAFGPELVTEGDFSAGGVNWSTEGEATANTGVGHILSTAGALSSVFQPGIYDLTKNYRLRYEVVENNGGFLADSASRDLPSTVGLHVVNYSPAPAQTLTFKRGLGLPCDIKIDNVSVREVL